MNIFTTVIDGKTFTFKLREETPVDKIEGFKEALEMQSFQKLYEFEQFISVDSWTVFVSFGDKVEVYARECALVFEVQ